MASFLVPDGIDDPWYGAGNPYGGDSETGQISKRRQITGASDQLPSIERVVAMSVLPELKTLLGGARPEGGVRTRSYRRPSDDEVILFSDIATKCDTDAAMKFIVSLLDRGVPIESIYLDLIAPAAKFLGEMWEDDLCDFAGVTLGSSCLQRTLVALSEKYASQRDILSRRSALILTMPGDQHTLGPSVAAEFLRRYGWDVECVCPESVDDVYSITASQDFDIVGFSVSCDDDIDSLSDVVRGAREAAGQRTIGVLAGGRAIAEWPEVIADSDIDAIAENGRDTVIGAGKLFERLRSF